MRELFQTFYQQADPEQAVKMSAYMKGNFPFLGISTPLRRQLSKDFLKEAKRKGKIDWAFVEECWQMAEREFQYLATDYLETMQVYLTEDDLPSLKQLVVTKSWWDTVDSLDRTIGNINFPSPAVDQTMLAWSISDNIWLRRIAIDHQLLRKEKTKEELLEAILVNNLNQSDFFINKAMGWALRDYSKTNPAWVRQFIADYQLDLSPLTIREGSKYL